MQDNGAGDVANKVKKEIVIPVPEDASAKDEVKVSLPTATLKKLAESGTDVAIETKGIKFKLPSAIADLVGENLEISVKDVDQATEASAKAKADQVQDGKLSPAGKLYDFNLTSGNEKVQNFKKKPTIEISLKDIDLTKVDVNKLGAYVLNEESGQWDYVKSKIVDGKLVFEAPHFSIYTVMEYNKTFNDITNHWAKNDIEIMASQHIANGVDKDNFAPNSTITRAEFAALIVRALGLEGAGQNTFADVTSDAWYANEVSLAADAGIVTGMGNDTFAPNQNVTREQMAVMVARAYTAMKEMPIKGTNLEFTDKASISSWAAEAVKGSVKKSIITGFEDNTFRPQDNATRAQAIVMLKRLLEQ